MKNENDIYFQKYLENFIKVSFICFLNIFIKTHPYNLKNKNIEF